MRNNIKIIITTVIITTIILSVFFTIIYRIHKSQPTSIATPIAKQSLSNKLISEIDINESEMKFILDKVNGISSSSPNCIISFFIGTNGTRDDKLIQQFLNENGGVIDKQMGCMPITYEIISTKIESDTTPYMKHILIDIRLDEQSLYKLQKLIKYEKQNKSISNQFSFNNTLFRYNNIDDSDSDKFFNTKVDNQAVDTELSNIMALNANIFKDYVITINVFLYRTNQNYQFNNKYKITYQASNYMNIDPLSN